MNRSEKDGEGEKPEATGTPQSTQTKTPAKMQEQINAYRLQNSRPVFEELKCLRCDKIFNSGNPEPLFNPFGSDPLEPVNFQLCSRCYQHMFLTGSQRGLKVLNARMGKEIPQCYLNREFRSFDVSGPFGQQLAAIRDEVIDWTKAVLNGSKISFFLFSEFKSPSVTGNGVGKTLLASIAYQYIAKRRYKQKGLSIEDDEQIDLDCRFVDLQDVVSDFLRQKKSDPDVRPTYPLIAGGGTFWKMSFDGYIQYLARRPILFLDDIGQGLTTGMLPNAYETLLDIRAAWEGPTFVTSNFSLESLGERIGTRAVSRLRRLNCCVRELQIPDYHRVHQKDDIRSMIQDAKS